MESPVGMTRWNLLSWFLVRRFLWKIILIDCHVQVRGPFCCLPKVHVDRALLFGGLEHSLNLILKKWSNMSWVTATILRDLKSRNRCWVGQLEGALLEHATHVCSLYVSVGLWGWCAPETCADCIRHVGYWWEVCKIMECYITEELCILSWQEAAAHLAGQDVAGSVELEWPQSRSWHSAACRWVRHILLFGSHHIFLFWAWRGVAVVWQKSCSEQDVVSGRWRRFGDGRRPYVLRHSSLLGNQLESGFCKNVICLARAFQR